MNGPPPESLCVQKTLSWHLETARPLLSLISGEFIRDRISGALYGDAFAAVSLPPYEMPEHELTLAVTTKSEMTKHTILVIVFIDIHHRTYKILAAWNRCSKHS